MAKDKNYDPMKVFRQQEKAKEAKKLKLQREKIRSEKDLVEPSSSSALSSKIMKNEKGEKIPSFLIELGKLKEQHEKFHKLSSSDKEKQRRLLGQLRVLNEERESKGLDPLEIPSDHLTEQKKLDGSASTTRNYAYNHDSFGSEIGHSASHHLHHKLDGDIHRPSMFTGSSTASPSKSFTSIEAKPQLRNLQKEATAFVPSSIYKKQSGSSISSNAPRLSGICHPSDTIQAPSSSHENVRKHSLDSDE